MDIAKILKDKPEGTKLYSVVYGKVTLDERVLYDPDHPEYSTINYVNKFCGTPFSLPYDGKQEKTGECLLFPSKIMRDWEKFAWKKGDVLISQNINGNTNEIIFDHFASDDYRIFIGKHLISTDSNSNVEYIADEDDCMTSFFTKGDSKDAECYFNTLEEMLGGKLNKKTLEIKKNEYTFIPYEKVIVRDTLEDTWHCDIFSNRMKDYTFRCVGGVWMQCLPFNSDTEKLVGTAENYK